MRMSEETANRNLSACRRSAFVAAAMGIALGANGAFAQAGPQGQPSAAPPAAQPAPLPVFTPYHKSGIYDVNEKVGWTVTLPDGATPPAAPYTYTVQINEQATLKTGELDLSSGKAILELSYDQPAMLNVQVNPPGGAGGGGRGRGGGFGGGGGRGRGGVSPYSWQLGAAIAPTKLEPTAPKPADFDAFWDGKLKALAAIPINPQLTEAPQDPPGQKEYMVKLDSVDSHTQGFLAKPDKDGKFPALILYQYAGVYALPETNVTNRAAQGWLCMDVDSHDIPPTQGQTPNLQNYQSQGNNDREKCYFLDMYLRDTRAVQYIKSRPDWDGKTIVLMGTSMGGQQTLVTAGLNDGITAALAWVPSGTDFDGPLKGHKAGYPNWNARDAKVAETGLYFDVVNFAPRIKAPTIIAMGFLDTTASPVGIWTAYDQIPGNKEIIPMPRAAHNNQAPAETEQAWAKRSEEVLAAILKGEPVKPGGVAEAQ